MSVDAIDMEGKHNIDVLLEILEKMNLIGQKEADDIFFSIFPWLNNSV